MPSRRDLISMTPQEIAAYLATQKRMILVTNGPDGMPHPVPMSFGLDDEGRILMSGFGKSQKVRNLERDPRATLLVESGAAYSELKSVIAYADAQILTDPDEVLPLIARIASEDGAAALAKPLSDQARASLAKRVILRFTPFRYVSWDHAKLAGVY